MRIPFTFDLHFANVRVMFEHVAHQCNCGTYIKRTKKFCKNCAVQYLMQFETDRFEVEQEPVAVLTRDEARLWAGEPAKRAPRKLRRRVYDEAGERQKATRKALLGISLIIVIAALACWRICS